MELSISTNVHVENVGTQESSGKKDLLSGA